MVRTYGPVELCTTYVARHRHLSRDLAASDAGPRVPGRMGHTLCREVAYDADRVAWHGIDRQLDDLPPCHNCERTRRSLRLDAPEGWELCDPSTRT